MFKPCIVIPVYNHKDKIDQIVQSISLYQLPCFLVDDGSNKACQRQLAKTAKHHEAVALIRLEQNQGKGVAVCTGLQAANKAGFSHALQIDADGQHDLDDIPKFLKKAQEHPQALISGTRPYSQMPGNRRYGRMLTDFWVCVNTLSSKIRDSMCGYRVYPLAQTCALLSKQEVCSRMDFDSDIIVRLYWDEVQVINIDTTVRYDEDNFSHFNLWQDNIRISRMHARLFFGMLSRIHRLLRLKFKPHA